MIVRRSLTHCALLALVLAPSRARAQATTVTQAVTVSAFVNAILSATSLQNLAFGGTNPGTPLTLAPPSSPGCTVACVNLGKWKVTNMPTNNGAPHRYLDLTFALPSTLVEPASGATMPISWTNAAQMCLSSTTAEYYCYGAWTPVNGVQRGMQINGGGAPAHPPGGAQEDAYIYLGGTISPTTSQRAGTYHGVVTLTFAYGAT